MSVHIERAVTEVVTQAEPSREGAREETAPWQRDAQVRAAFARHVRRVRRTTAEGFDD